MHGDENLAARWDREAAQSQWLFNGMETWAARCTRRGEAGYEQRWRSGLRLGYGAPKGIPSIGGPGASACRREDARRGVRRDLGLRSTGSCGAAGRE